MDIETPSPPIISRVFCQGIVALETALEIIWLKNLELDL